METAERRNKIIIALCRRKFDAIPNLAAEFGVSERTIRRDIVALSLSHPIYTQCGKTGGGVYINPEYSIDRIYMESAEIGVLQKLKRLAEMNSSLLTQEELHILNGIVADYSKPESSRNRN